MDVFHHLRLVFSDFENTRTRPRCTQDLSIIRFRCGAGEVWNPDEDAWPLPVVHRAAGVERDFLRWVFMSGIYIYTKSSERDPSDMVLPTYAQ